MRDIGLLMPTEPANTIDLWTCLHDGEIKALRSDLLERTLSFVIDAPFHWEFQGLPSDTRFELVGKGVRATQASSFEPWPGATEPTHDMPWDQAQEIRVRDAKLGRLISSDWTSFAAQVGRDEDYIVMSAELVTNSTSPVLRLGVIGYPNSLFREIEIRGESFHFFVGNLDFPVDEFTRFGDAYWEDWSKKSKVPPSSKDTSQ